MESAMLITAAEEELRTVAPAIPLNLADDGEGGVELRHGADEDRRIGRISRRLLAALRDTGTTIDFARTVMDVADGEYRVGLRAGATSLRSRLRQLLLDG